MIYSRRDIEEALASGLLVIDPQPIDEMFSTSSVDLQLGDTFTIFDEPASGVEISVLLGRADPEQVALQHGKVERVPANNYFRLHPNRFVLAYTRERVEIPQSLAARVEGKSSLARFGLSIHQTAPTIQAGFRGHIRLEITNVGPFVCHLTPGISICQLIIEELKTTPSEPLRSRFQNQSPN